MTRFSRAVVVGDRGGIGAAVAERLRARGCDVIGLSRRSDPPLDLEDPDAIRAAFDSIEGEIDLLFIATGLLHDEQQQPEKTWRAIDKASFERAFAINATGPALVIKEALRLVPRDKPCAIAALAARVGSIGDNRLGGWYAYRASKAALAMLVKTFSIELARTHEQLTLVALHPGTVDTGLSQPFQSNVPDGKLFTPRQSADYLLGVLDTLGPRDSGGHFDWAGERVEA